MRVNFNYFLSDAVADYIVEAVRLVARDGWRLLGDYRFDIASGRWTHRDGLVEPPLRLGAITYDEHGMQPPTSQLVGDESLLAAAPQRWREDPRRCVRARPHAATSLSEDFEHLRWFDLPAAAVEG